MKNEKIKKTAKSEPEEISTEEKEIKVNDEGVVKGSNAKKKLAAVIEKYKLQNPVKYGHKKVALEKQLASL